MTRTVTCLADIGCTLGEGPLWDHERGCLWFVDIKEHTLFRFDPQSSALSRYAAPGQIGWVIPATDGRLVAGLKDGLHWFSPESGAFSFWQCIPGEPEGNRLNDACTDDQGRIWFGSMDDGESAKSGRFYCLDGGVIHARGPGAISITNGPAVAAGRDIIYFTDTADGHIHVAHLDTEGTVDPARPFVSIASSEGHPDGLIVDSEGCVWTGIWGGTGPRRYSPEGALLETVAMPVKNVTKLVLGGADMKTAYVTTASKGLDPASLSEQPLAGGLFSFSVDVAGSPVVPYRI